MSYNSVKKCNIRTSGESSQWTSFPHAMVKGRNCHMCGGTGHQADTCPNACCLVVRILNFPKFFSVKIHFILQCGEKTNVFMYRCNKCLQWASAVCNVCADEDHTKGECLRYWRCYNKPVSIYQFIIATMCKTNLWKWWMSFEISDCFCLQMNRTTTGEYWIFWPRQWHVTQSNENHPAMTYWC